MTGYNELRDGQEFYGNGYKQGYSDAIDIIRTTCKYCNTCIECPMNINCNEQPAHWKEVNNGKEETT